jgi:hypothetical protein
MNVPATWTFLARVGFTFILYVIFFWMMADNRLAAERAVDLLLGLILWLAPSPFGTLPTPSGVSNGEHTQERPSTANGRNGPTNASNGWQNAPNAGNAQ